jgi:hypothetical protein
MVVTCESIVRKLIVRVEGYCAYLEAKLLQRINVDEQTTVKDKSGLVHAIIDRSPVNSLELLPLGGDNHRFSPPTSLERRSGDRDLLLDYIN